MPINVILLSLALLVGIILVTFVWRRSHKILRENVEEAAESSVGTEREQLMPIADVDVNDYGAVNGGGSGTLSPTQEHRGRRL